MCVCVCLYVCFCALYISRKRVKREILLIYRESGGTVFECGTKNISRLLYMAPEFVIVIIFILGNGNKLT